MNMALWSNCSWYSGISSGFRHLERGVQPLVHEECPKMFGLATPTSIHVNAFMTHAYVIIVTFDF